MSVSLYLSVCQGACTFCEIVHIQNSIYFNFIDIRVLQFIWGIPVGVHSVIVILGQNVYLVLRFLKIRFLFSA